jgi:peptidoglycan/xylan/chitin deacetylase (PgdA/CDA1 family)
MKFAYCTAFALALTACSHATTTSRNPSSVVPAASMEVTLEQLLDGPDPRGDARAFVDRLLRIELRAHGWMYETDEIFKHAKGPVDLFAQDSYKKLLVSRPLIDHTQAKIVELYKEAHMMTLPQFAALGGSAHAGQAGLVVQGVHDALLHAHENPAERVLLNDLMQALREARDSVAPPNDSHPHKIVAPLSAEELGAAAAAAAPAIQEAITQLPDTDEVKEEVEKSVSDVNGNPTDAGREPNSLNVFPSVSANGNIDGFTFPKGTWAVTFDDGPHPTISQQDLANLQQAGQKATFFWLAMNLDAHQGVVKTVQAAGMPVEDHSWSHPQLDKASDLARLHTTLDKEINQSFAEDTKIYGEKPKFFRCPYGAGFKDPTIRGMIAKNGMIHVRWNVDSLDWKDPNPVTVKARVDQQMKANGRGIILFHDIHTPAVTVVPQLFAEYKGQVRWVTIPQIVDELNGIHAPPAGGVIKPAAPTNPNVPQPQPQPQQPH